MKISRAYYYIMRLSFATPFLSISFPRDGDWLLACRKCKAKWKQMTSRNKQRVGFPSWVICYSDFRFSTLCIILTVVENQSKIIPLTHLKKSNFQSIIKCAAVWFDFKNKLRRVMTRQFLIALVHLKKSKLSSKIKWDSFMWFLPTMILWKLEIREEALFKTFSRGSNCLSLSFPL